MRIALLLLAALAPQQDDDYKPEIHEPTGEGEAHIQAMQVPAGFKVELWAEEPMLANPVCLYVTRKGDCYLGETFRRLGRAADAARAYEAALQAKPDSRFLPAIRLGTARAWTAAKSYGKAESTLKAFAREVDSKRLHRQYALSAKQGLGRNLEAQGKYSQARREYDSVITEARSSAARAKGPGEKQRLHLLSLRAQRDKGGAYVKEKNYGDASGLFEKMASTRDDKVARAIGMMGQGEVRLAQGQADRARVLLSEVAALGFEAAGERPRVLRLLTETYIALAAAGERGATGMARSYVEDLLRNHPGTEEAKAARALQQKLK